MEKNDLKILIVDHNQANLTSLIDLLGGQYNVISAGSGEQALEILENSFSEIMVVLMELMLPGINGFDVLKEMDRRKILDDIPVILLSSELEQTDSHIDKAFSLGAADYIARPYGAALLKKRIKDTLSLHSRHKEQIVKLNHAADQAQQKGSEVGVDEAYMIDMLQKLKLVNDTVRIVDASKLVEYTLTDDGHICKSQKHCYDVWNKCRRCENCISARAYKDKGKHSKYEFIGNNVYLATSKYIEINGVPFSLEMVSKADDTVFMDAFGKESMIETILAQNEKMFVDALTGAYNRHYFEEQLFNLKITAIAMIDVDHFKPINDTYGHLAGDEVLQTVAATLKKQLLGADALIRYGGDEFLVAFTSTTEGSLKRRVEQMKNAVAALKFEKYEGLSLSLSIGAVTAEQCNEDVLKRTDEKLYEAKKTRNCTVV